MSDNSDARGGRPANPAVFISYSSEDKKLASRLKGRLGEFGIAAFLAHDDIPGGSEWKDAIREKIRESSLLLALVTDTYHDHEYTDQELGMAIFADKPIACIAVDGGRPRGFASSYQHIKYDTANTERPWANMELLGAEAAKAALAAMDGEKLVDFAVGRLVHSRHFGDSDVLAACIDENALLSESQARLLAVAFVKNDQVHYADRFAGKRILSVLRRHLGYLDRETVAKVKGVAGGIDRYGGLAEELQSEERRLARPAGDGRVGGEGAAHAPEATGKGPAPE